MGVWMDGKRSYLDTLNDGRQRRAETTLEQLNRSLETLERQLEGKRDPQEQPRAQAMPAPKQFASQPRPPLPREIERPQADEDSVATVERIAAELKSLREDLRQQMNSRARRSPDMLRSDPPRSHAPAPKNSQGGDLDHGLQRLCTAVSALTERIDSGAIDLLRGELEQVKTTVGGLAREESVNAMSRRWDELDSRLADFQNHVTAELRRRREEPNLLSLMEKLDRIGGAVSELPDSLPLRSLEDKVRLLAGAVDHFARQQDRFSPGMFEAVEERLDEISRAIVAVSVRTAPLDRKQFERVEARITALAKQIEELAEDRSTTEVVDRLTQLSRRVEELATQAELPAQAIERLGERFETIAARLETASPLQGADTLLRDLERRLDDIAERQERYAAAPALDDTRILDTIDARFSELALQIERRPSEDWNEDLIRNLESRMQELMQRLDRPAVDFAYQDTHLLDTIETRFAELAQRIESHEPEQDALLRSFEARLGAISEQLESTIRDVAAIDPALIRSLEAQVALLAGQLSHPQPALDDIGPRLDQIENAIAESRISLLEAARQAAENAVRNFAGSEPDNAMVAALAEELKALESLSRRSDERNSKSFEAIHDTLLKIVDHLAALDASRDAGKTGSGGTDVPLRKIEIQEAPSIDFDAASDLSPINELNDERGEKDPESASAQTAAEAASAAGDEEPARAEASGGVRSMLGNLSRAFAGRKQEAAAAGDVGPDAARRESPKFDLDEPLDPKLANRPLEPGSGAPDLHAIMRRVREERNNPAGQTGTDAAKADFIAAARRAAQAAAAEAEILKRHSDGKGPLRRFSIGSFVKTRRTPMLLAATAIMVVLAGLQLGKAFMDDGGELAASGPVREMPTTGAATTSNAEGTAENTELAATGGGTNAPRNVGVTAPAKAMLAEPVPAAIEVPAEAGPVTLREAAEGGDSKALYEIGARYAEGRGVKANIAAAAKWYERSAEFGFAPAQYRIGNLYEKGAGVSRDIAKAKTWYQLAAASGNASAMHNLAVLFAMGADGVADNDSAGLWFKRAAELGIVDSQFNLGILAAKGVGMKQDLEESYKWFALVAKTGDKDAALKRDEVAKSLKPEQLERARAAAELWEPRAVDPEANIVEIPESWRESNTTTAGIDVTQAVQAVQSILNKNGYDAGSADGIIGERTKLAVAAFQSDNGMQPTGQIDEALVNALLARN